MKPCRMTAVQVISSDWSSAQETHDDEKKRTVKQRAICSVSDCPLDWTPAASTAPDSQVHTQTHAQIEWYILCYY